MSIEIKNINYFYNDNLISKHQALFNINITINEGDIVAIAGKTGSSKSTLAEIIAGLTSPSSGNVLIDGVDIYANKNKKEKLLAKETKRKIGMVFQYSEYQLFEETVLKDIAFAPKEMGFSDKEIKEKVNRAINLVGLNEDILNRSPFTLSGGEKRKVAIAGILAFSPKYLILDEPTVGLDYIGRNEILNLILRLNKEEHTTVMFISHSMENIAEFAKKVIVMNDGKVVDFDNVCNIFTNDELLRNVGLSRPKISNFLEKLNAANIKIKSDIFKFDEGIAEIINFFRR